MRIEFAGVVLALERAAPGRKVSVARDARRSILHPSCRSLTVSQVGDTLRVRLSAFDAAKDYVTATEFD
jgi:hypothetical protein